MNQLQDLILQYVIEHSSVSAREIARMSGRKIQTVSAILSGLKRDGYVYNEDGKWYPILE